MSPQLFGPALTVCTRILGVKVTVLFLRIFRTVSVDLVRGTDTGCNGRTITTVNVILGVIALKSGVICKFIGKFRPVTKCGCDTKGCPELGRTVQ